MMTPKTILYGAKSIVYRGLSWLTSPQTARMFGEPVFWLAGMRRKSKELDLSQVQRVLVVRLDEIGDMVLCFPLLRELRRLLPQARITLVVKPSVYNLVELCPYVDEILTYDWRVSDRFGVLRRHGRALTLACHHLLPRRFDLAILPRWDADRYHASYVVYFSGAPWRIAYSESVTARKGLINHGFDRLFTHVLRDNAIKHQVEHNLDIIRFLGRHEQNVGLEMWIGAEDEAFAESLLKDHAIGPQDMLIAFAPGAGWPGRQWPLVRFAELGRWLQAEHGARIVIVGGPGEEPLGLELQQTLGSSVVNACGKTTLRQMAALLGRCSLFVGNDAGPMHVAAATGVPVVALFGSGWYQRFAPWCKHYTIVRSQLPCSPCGEQCVYDRPWCMLGITVEQVKRAVVEQLRQAQASIEQLEQCRLKQGYREWTSP